MIQIIKSPNLNFIGTRKIAYGISCTLILAGIASFIIHKGPVYGIDFTGGSLVRLHFEQQISANELRTKISQLGIKGATIQEEKGLNTYLIKTMAEEGIGRRIAQSFTPQPTVEQEELIGSSISEGFKKKVIWIILLSWAVMLVYVWVRFTSIRWGACAILALVHDVVITAGMLSILNKEFTISIVAALLTIIGYSINDTIVVSDRVRENLRVMRKTPLPELINHSINQTFSRTILTSLTVLFIVLVLYFFGGQILKDFALALLIGIVVGTYSSIYVVAALVVDWDLSSKKKVATKSSK
jgi:preprotein translocase subunit SecF